MDSPYRTRPPGEIQPAASAYEAHVRNVLTAEAVKRGCKPDLPLIVKLAKEIARTAPAGVSRT